MNDQQANALFGEAAQLLHQGQASAALKILTKLDQAIPSNPGILYYIATAYSLTGSKHKAIQIYERVMRLNPQFIEAYNNIALDHAYLGEHEKAIGFIDQALSIRPDFIEAIDNKGCFLNAIGKYQEACHTFKSALSINPNDAMALANLSVALIHLGKLDEASAYAETLIRMNPHDHKGYSNLGKISLKLEKTEDALVHFQAALQRNPSDIDTLAALGVVCSELNEHERAQEYFDRALTLDPHNGATHLGLALMHHDRRDFKQAIHFFSTPIQDKNRLTLREYNRALTYLHAGVLLEGWSDYSWRWKESDLPIKYMETASPLWDGKETNGKVFIWHEQGVGDQILFGSLLHEAIKQAPNLLVRLDERLLPLFQRSFTSAHFITPDSPLYDEDIEYHLPMADLGRLFRTDLNDFLRQPANYLKADSKQTEQSRKQIGATTPVVGISWLTRGKRSRERNLPIEEVVSSIHHTLPCQFIDLQYSDTTNERRQIADELGVLIRHLNEIDNLNDLDGLASLIDACDFVVTCSNTTAHLAGALGKQTYLLVPFSRGRHWYWSHLSEASNSLWYPSIQVIPQTIPGDWTQPLATLNALLSKRKN